MYLQFGLFSPQETLRKSYRHMAEAPLTRLQARARGLLVRKVLVYGVRAQFAALCATALSQYEEWLHEEAAVSTQAQRSTPVRR